MVDEGWFGICFKTPSETIASVERLFKGSFLTSAIISSIFLHENDLIPFFSLFKNRGGHIYRYYRLEFIASYRGGNEKA